MEEGAGRPAPPGLSWTSRGAHWHGRSPRRRYSPGRTHAARHSRPLAARRRSQRLSEARRRRVARAAGSDGSGSCHVEGAGEVIVGVEGRERARVLGLGSRWEGRPYPWDPGFAQGAGP